MNGISNTFIPNTLSGLESLNATNITINGVDISTLYVPFVNSPYNVDLSDKNLTTSGRVQTTVLKLPSMTYSTTKVLRVNSDKEVESVDLVSTFLPYSGATSDLDMGTQRIIYYQGAYPTSDNDVINRFYVQSYYLSLTDASSTYLTIANAASTYLTISNASATYQTQAGMPSFIFTGVPTITSAPAANDDSDKIPTTHWVNYAMSLIYLPITTAASTYLTITNAASTYATITNLNLKANSASPTFTGTVVLPSTISFTTNPSAGVGTLLAIDGTGNLITTTSSLNQTATSTSGTYYLTFVSSSATGAFNPLVFSQIMCNPNVGLIEVNNMKITSRNQGGSQVSLLGRDSAGNVIDGFMSQTASSANTDFPVGFIQSSGTGLFTPLSETSGAFTFNPSTLNLKTSKLQITSVPTGTQQYLLAVDSAGNVIQGTSAGGVTSFSAGSTGFLPNSATTGAITLSGSLNVANGGTGATTTTGTAGANVLSVSPALTGTPTAPTAGAGTNTTQIATTEFVTTAVSAFSTPTQINATALNTSVSLYPAWFQSTAGGVSTVYVESDGSLFYNPSTNRLTVPIANATVVETSAIQNSSGQIININAQGGAITGNRLNLQIQSTTYYYFDKDAFYLTQPVNNVISSILNDLYILWPSAKILSFNNWVQIDNTGLLMAGTRKVYTQNLETQPTTDLNINVPTSSNLCNFQINGSTVLSVNSTGLRPSTDTLSLVYSSMPTLKFTDGTNNMTIVSYVGGAEFRYAGTTRLGFDATGMYVNNIRNISGVNLDINGNGAGIVNLQSYGNNVFQTNATGCRVTASSGSLVFTNTANIQTDSDGFNWYIGGASQVGYFDKNAWATGYGWRIHSNAFATYECAYDMIIQCKTGGVPQYGANNRIINVITPNSINSPNDIGGSGWYCGATVFRSENGGNVGNGIGISTSSNPGYGGNNWGYITAVNPGNYWTNWIFAGATGYWYCNGTACAYINSTSGWQAVSDERCKKDINDLSTKKSLQRVLKCKPKYYKRILKEPKGENPIPLRQQDIDRVDIGLLAQEVLEYNPHCVSTWQDDTEDGEKVERLGLAYQDFIIHLIGSVQEQQKQIDTQQAKIEEQSQAINTLTDSMKLLSEHLAKLTTAFNEVVKEK
jgi:hypothetical protein